MRVSDWTIRLACEVEAAALKTFAWGEWDCCQFAASIVATLTGRDPRDIFPAYTAESEALRIINDAGGMDALITQALGEPKPRSFAQRGDIVLCDFGRGPQPAVCLGVWCVAPGAVGLEKRLTDNATLAWAV
jgi:hypothetical protein